jgi:hypothetical protein
MVCISLSPKIPGSLVLYIVTRKILLNFRAGGLGLTQRRDPSKIVE